MPEYSNAALAALKYAIAFILVGSVTFVISIFILVPDQVARALGPLSMSLVAIFAWVLLARGRTAAAIYLLVYGLYAAVTGIAFFNGGIRAMAIIVYPQLILILGWLIGARAAVLMAALAVAATFGFVMAETFGILPDPFATPAVMRWIVDSFIFAFSVILIVSFVRSYQDRLKQAEKLAGDLAQRSADLDHAQSLAHVGSWVYEPGTGVMRLSAETCRIFGVPDGTSGNRDLFFALVHRDDRDAWDAVWQQALTGGEPVEIEHRAVVGDATRWVRQRVVVEFDADRTPFRIVGTAQDVTERKQAEEAHRESESKFKKAFDANPDSININRLEDGLYVSINSGFTRIMGYTEDDIIGCTSLEFNVWDNPEDRARLVAGLKKDGLVTNLEARFRAKNGNVIDGLMSAAIVQIKDVPHVLSITRDMSEHAREAQLLRLEHAISRRLAEAGDVSSALREVMRAICEAQEWGVAMYWRVDETAGVLRLGESWNMPESRLERYTEVSREATFAPGAGLVGRVWQSGEPIWVADFSSDPRVVQKALAQELNMQGALMFPMISGGRTLGVFAFLGLALREPDERLIAATRVIGNEVGQFLRRKRAEAELHESEARFRSMAEMSSDFYWETDSEHRILLRSAGSRGSSLSAMAHGSPFGLRRWDIPYLSPDEAGWEAHRATLAERLPIRNFEFSRLGKDGSERHISINGDPVFDAADGFRGYRGVGTDISERKRHGVELQRLNEDLEQRVQQRTQELQVANNELEAFSYSVSHDLRAPLRAIHGFSSLVEKQYAGQIDEQGRDMLRRVGAGVNKMGALIDDLLRLSRISRQTMRIQPVDLSVLAWEVVGELQDDAPERKIEWVIAPQLSAEGDPGLLRVALQNLIGNAWKYSSKREGPRIEFGVAQWNGQAAYFVRDNGAGFDMAYAEKLFGAFQRLHSPGEFPGTGIGLATVKRIVHRHGGEVGAESEIGEGATFYFTL